MSLNLVKEHFEKSGFGERIKKFETSCATVEVASKSVGVIPARIAKTLILRKDEACMMLLMAGDAGVDNKKFRHTFKMKARMLTPDEVFEMTGQVVGAVSPFAVPPNVSVYIDVSIKRFETLYPACGSEYHVIELTPDEIFESSNAIAWVDVCKGWE